MRRKERRSINMAQPPSSLDLIQKPLRAILSEAVSVLRLDVAASNLTSSINCLVH
jgi:hypothetical protein